MYLNRKIAKILVHCSASGPKTTIADIRKWHKEQGWSDIGYHFVILSDGTIEYGRKLEVEGAHCKGHNKDSIGICLVGGKDGTGKLHHFSKKQLDMLQVLIDGLKLEKPIGIGKVPVFGHREFNNKKECPCFSVIDTLDNARYPDEDILCPHPDKRT